MNLREQPLSGIKATITLDMPGPAPLGHRRPVAGRPVAHAGRAERDTCSGAPLPHHRTGGGTTRVHVLVSRVTSALHSGDGTWKTGVALVRAPARRGGDVEAAGADRVSITPIGPDWNTGPVDLAGAAALPSGLRP